MDSFFQLYRSEELSKMQLRDERLKLETWNIRVNDWTATLLTHVYGDNSVKGKIRSNGVASLLNPFAESEKTSYTTDDKEIASIKAKQLSKLENGR